MSHFVLEVGSEELPARFLPTVEKEVRERMEQALASASLPYESLSVHSTPRRTVLHLHGLAASQPLREEVALGPSVKAAFDAAGKPTKAAEGFARGQGVDVSSLFTTETEKGVYVAARKSVGGANASDVLAEICPAMISALPFPKRMRWGSGTFAYARPMHWIVALLDDAVVPFSVGSVSTGRETWGHRIHGPGPFSVTHADALDGVLEQQCCVMVDAAERRAITRQGGDVEAKKLNGRILWKESLLDEVQGLTECPVPLLGDFDPSFLEIPREVLLTSMEVHQKSFGVESADGQLLPHFLTVLNIKPAVLDLVKKGWERVLRARLEDARFYWRTDLEHGFTPWLAELDNVIFLGPLGSMGDKCRRLEGLSAWLAEKTTSADPVLAARAGLLSKTDLVSEMVGEFDTLQGIMGGIYARRMGENSEVAAALPEQYLPAGPDSPVPSTALGALLSLADKADTLVGCFGLGNIPTGAADPYALRRCALGIARIILENGYRLSVHDIFAKAQSLYKPDIAWKLPPAEALAKLDEFFASRLKNLFLSRGSDTLLVEAVLNAGHQDVWAAGQRLAALTAESHKPGFADNAQTFKRVANILRKQEGSPLSGEWKNELLTEDAEKALAVALKRMSAAFENLWANDRFGDLLALMDEVRPAVDDFFNHVMVMAEQPALRENRLNLLQALLLRMGKLADFSALQL